ncbi:MoaD/ThiS family protein [Desulforhopalus singaporensis]|uniref:ThiS family protein n=1 Tax=Desulforhopalus singaporensis TaxID=91360 RepID=A0A1H0VG87_9BACT|nr:MoaD/ThiS family protein [Desulforhopalus singaporensis]SDP77353.1 ThiS family protein [Desulforhopalus singaporensis]
MKLRINSNDFEFPDKTDVREVITEALRHPKLMRLTRVKHQHLVYCKNKKIIPYDQLLKEGLVDGDEISILMFVSGG